MSFLVLLLALLTPFKGYYAPTSSMNPAIMMGDRFFANRVVWGFGPYTLGIVELPMGNNRWLVSATPNRGDIAVFHNANDGQLWIKRIIGMPGDRIQMRYGHLYLNGALVMRQEIGSVSDTDSFGQAVRVTVYAEMLPGVPVHRIQEISDGEALDNTSEYVVPPGHYFMMGDNRDRSSDSRVQNSVGYVPEAALIARVLVGPDGSVVTY